MRKKLLICGLSLVALVGALVSPPAASAYFCYAEGSICTFGQACCSGVCDCPNGEGHTCYCSVL